MANNIQKVRYPFSFFESYSYDISDVHQAMFDAYVDEVTYCRHIPLLGDIANEGKLHAYHCYIGADYYGKIIDIRASGYSKELYDLGIELEHSDMRGDSADERQTIELEMKSIEDCAWSDFFESFPDIVNNFCDDIQLSLAVQRCSFMVCNQTIEAFLSEGGDIRELRIINPPYWEVW